MPDLLDTLSKKDVKIFIRDFIQLMRVAKGMDMDYADSNKDLDIFLPRYKTLIRLFNKKYPGLQLKIKKTTEELKLRIFFKNEKSVKDILVNAAGKIIGLKSIGAKSFGAADINSEKFNQELNKLKNTAYISYYEQDIGSNMIILEYDKKTKLVELHYEFEDIIEEKNPGFKLCAFYALKEDYDKKIDLFGKGAEFAFNDWSENTKKAFLEKFDPLLDE